MVAPRVCYTVTLIHSDSYILIVVKIMKGEKCLRIQKPFTYHCYQTVYLHFFQFLLPANEKTFLVFRAVPLPTITSLFYQYSLLYRLPVVSVQGQIGQDDQAILSQHLKQRRLSELLVCRVDNIHNYTIHTYPFWNQNYSGYMSLVHFITLSYI